MSSRASTREQLIDAARDCFARQGLSKTSMEEVAQAAGVSRVTLYRHFEGREPLFAAVLLREGVRILAETRAALAPFEDDLDRWVLEAVLHLIEHSPRQPLYPMLFAPDAREWTARVSVSPQVVIEQATPLLQPLVERTAARGELREGVTAQGVAEWCVRLVMSFLTLPSTRAEDPRKLRPYLETMLPPLTLKR